MRIGLDIGGTKTDAVALAPDGRELARVRRPSGFGADEVVASADEAVREAVRRAGIGLADVTSVGVGIPGVVEVSTGRVRHAVNLGVADLNLAELLSRRLGAAVLVENDVKAASLGAWHLLGLSGSAALLNVGTGLSAGIVANGRVWRGPRGTAGEIGHVPVDPTGLDCSCGQVGCLETLASGSAIARRWTTDAALPAVDLFDRADAGDDAAIRVRDVFVDGVAQAVRMLVLSVDPETIVVGGGLSALGGRLQDRMREVFDRWAEASAFLASLDLPGRTRLLPSGTPVAAVGAAMLGSVPAFA
ncbi:MAG TPA: ROK family protein [Microbacterium sp.]|uniref:ROK family protein n=1 Tax=Microbacterium sp. TaxID=51671 RepID=UPI002B49EAB9|nr:ROK family protein [Microbacterium sp.]HKT56851.1 ROK family protein [Microbacterium sp.]